MISPSFVLVLVLVFGFVVVGVLVFANVFLVFVASVSCRRRSSGVVRSSVRDVADDGLV